MICVSPNGGCKTRNVLRDTAANFSAYRLLQDSSPDELLWDTVVEREELEKQILLYNKDSFRAAAESPCGHGVIHDALTFTSLSSEAEELLQGTVPAHWHGQDNVLRQFLASFAIPDHVKSCPEIPTIVSENDVLKRFKTWKETTSTSPSGRHLGHYKALIGHPTLLSCFTKFMNIAISQGIAIPRWCNATNVMIEKDPGKPRIHRLRIIHLFEADYNFFLKLQWGHRLVQQACRLNLLHDSQHGCNRSSATPHGQDNQQSQSHNNAFGRITSQVISSDTAENGGSRSNSWRQKSHQFYPPHTTLWQTT